MPEWFYAERGQQRGPVSFEELQAMAAAGQLRPSDLVWREGLPEWIPASTQPELFGQPAQRPIAPDEPLFSPSYGPRPSYRRPPPASGGGGGWMVLLAGGAAAVVLGLLCCGVIVVIGVGFNANKPKSNERQWSLDPGKATHWTVPFKKGDRVEITVTSTGTSDMDLFVFRSQGEMNAYLASRGNNPALIRNCVAYDIGDDSNCHVTFTAPDTQDYYLVLVNVPRQQMRDGPNSGKLVFTPAPK
jgi:hypothetical protein